MDTNFLDNANASNVGNEETPGLNVGIYTGLRVEKLKLFKGTRPGATHKDYFKAVFTVLKDENGHRAGDLVSMFETVSGSGFPHFDSQAQARVKKLLGAIAGLKTDAEINAQVKGADLALATSDAQPFKGQVVGAVVTAKNPKFPAVVCQAVDNAVPSLFAETTKVQAIDHTARALAAGWQPHPSAPGFLYLGQSVKSDADIKAGNF